MFVFRIVTFSSYFVCKHFLNTFWENSAEYKLMILQPTLGISNSKGVFKMLRDIRTSTYQICRLEEKTNRKTAFNKCICNWTLEIKDMLKMLWKTGEIAP